MPDISELRIVIRTDGEKQAIQNIDSVKRSGVEAQNSLKTINNISFSSLIGRIAAMAAAWASVNKAISLVHGAMLNVDKYNVSILSVASSLTNMAEQGDMSKIFQQNLAFSKNMYQAMALESSKHFANLQEMQTTYNRLTQSGYVVRLNEVGALGTLTDRIKLATAGQNTEVQLNTEIMALLSGQAKANSLLALELQSRLGPGWADLVSKHKEAGDLLTWLATLYPGLTAANKEIQDTIQSQVATTQSLITLVEVGGLSTAYADIVDLIKLMNEYLRDHRAELESHIAKIWENIKPLIEGSAKAIGNMTVALINFGAQLDSIAKNPAFMALFGAAAGSRFGPLGAAIGAGVGAGTALQLRNYDEVAKGLERAKRAQSGLIGYGSEGEGYPSAPVTSPAAIKPLPKVPSGGGGGGGADQTLKEIEKIKREVGQARRDAVDGASEAFMLMYKIKKSNADMYLEADKFQTTQLTQVKGYIDSLASSSSILTEQVQLKDLSLQYDIKISQQQLDQWLTQNKINGAQADSYRQLLALTNASKQYARERQREIEMGTLKGWAIERSSQQPTTVKDMMGGLESGMQNAFSSAWQGFLTQDKQSLAKAGQSIFQGLLGELTKGSIKKTFSGIAELLKPAENSATNYSSIGSGKGLTSVTSSSGAQLSKAAEGLNKASIGFNANTAQFGLAAGGLLLSGIGLATGSTGLVVAGTVLQFAGLAIQLYQAIAATTTAVSMTVAATALTGSAAALGAAASMLMMSAAVSAIPFFHNGGLIYAHTGWPRLKSDERPIIAQTGERVLSRAQNRAYESGLGGDSGGSSKPVHVQTTINVNAVDATGFDKVLAKHLPRHEKTMKNMLTKMHRNGVKA